MHHVHVPQAMLTGRYPVSTTTPSRRGCLQAWQPAVRPRRRRVSMYPRRPPWRRRAPLEALDALPFSNVDVAKVDKEQQVLGSDVADDVTNVLALHGDRVGRPEQPHEWEEVPYLPSRCHQGATGSHQGAIKVPSRCHQECHQEVIRRMVGGRVGRAACHQEVLQGSLGGWREGRVGRGAIHRRRRRGWRRTASACPRRGRACCVSRDRASTRACHEWERREWERRGLMSMQRDRASTRACAASGGRRRRRRRFRGGRRVGGHVTVRARVGWTCAASGRRRRRRRRRGTRWAGARRRARASRGSRGRRCLR